VFAFPGTPIYSYAVSSYIGETVHLPCGNNATVTTEVDWFYQLSPEARRRLIISLNYIANGKFEDRLNISETTLIINNVKKNDSGLYSCVENTSHRRKYYVNFTVKGKVNEFILCYVSYTVTRHTKYNGSSYVCSP